MPWDALPKFWPLTQLGRWFGRRPKNLCARTLTAALVQFVANFLAGRGRPNPAPIIWPAQDWQGRRGRKPKGLFGLSPILPYQIIGITNSRAWPKNWQVMAVWIVAISTCQFFGKTIGCHLVWSQIFGNLDWTVFGLVPKCMPAKKWSASDTTSHISHDINTNFQFRNTQRDKL